MARILWFERIMPRLDRIMPRFERIMPRSLIMARERIIPRLERIMPLFLTLRDGEGTALATAMLPSPGQVEPSFRIIIVGVSNQDPYPEHGTAIAALGRHYGMPLERARCYPYARS